MSITPTTSFSGAFVAAPVGAPSYSFVIRKDLNQIAILDTLTPCKVATIDFRTRPFGITKQDGRLNRIQGRRLRVYGTGTLDNGIVLAQADNCRCEWYSANICTGTPDYGAERGLLFFVEFSQNFRGYVLDFRFILTGTGLDITDVVLDPIELN